MGSFFTQYVQKDEFKESSDLYNDENIINAEHIIKKMIELNNDKNINKLIKNKRLNELAYDVDIIVCKLNTEYNKNGKKMTIKLLNNHNKIISHINNLKIKYINQILMENL